MKSLVLAVLTFVAANAQATQVLNPQSGDRIVCRDNTSGLTYDISVVDIGDEEARVVVRDRFGRVTAKFDNQNDRFAQIQFADSAFAIITVDHGDQADVLVFARYDLDRAYLDLGDAHRALECRLTH